MADPIKQITLPESLSKILSTIVAEKKQLFEKFKQLEIEKELQNLKKRITQKEKTLPAKDLQKENPPITDEQIESSIQDMLNSLE